VSCEGIRALSLQSLGFLVSPKFPIRYYGLAETDLVPGSLLQQMEEDLTYLNLQGMEHASGQLLEQSLE
jgi:hypothetical protein